MRSKGAKSLTDRHDARKLPVDDTGDVIILINEEVSPLCHRRASDRISLKLCNLVDD